MGRYLLFWFRIKKHCIAKTIEAHAMLRHILYIYHTKKVGVVSRKI